MLNFAAATRRGVGKQKNEDRIMAAGSFLSKGELCSGTAGAFLSVLCDGIGGEAGGDEAASIACLHFLSLSGEIMTPFSVSSAVGGANAAVRRRQEGERKHMSATLAGIYVDEKGYIAFNTGDSRVYMLGKTGMLQLSKDHTQAQELVNSGRIASASDAPKRLQNTVTRYIGGCGETNCAALHKGNFSNGTMFLLCSDGVYKKVNDVMLFEILSSGLTLSEKCRAACDLAVENGSNDDLSVVLVRKEV